jgi:hypothetical protein
MPRKDNRKADEGHNMVTYSVTDCIEEAVELLTDAANAASSEDRLGLLKMAEMWLTIAKHKIADLERHENGGHA